MPDRLSWASWVRWTFGIAFWSPSRSSLWPTALRTSLGMSSPGWRATSKFSGGERSSGPWRYARRGCPTLKKTSQPVIWFVNVSIHSTFFILSSLFILWGSLFILFFYSWMLFVVWFTFTALRLLNQFWKRPPEITAVTFWPFGVMQRSGPHI